MQASPAGPASWRTYSPGVLPGAAPTVNQDSWSRESESMCARPLLPAREELHLRIFQRSRLSRKSTSTPDSSLLLLVLVDMLGVRSSLGNPTFGRHKPRLGSLVASSSSSPATSCAPTRCRCTYCKVLSSKQGRGCAAPTRVEYSTAFSPCLIYTLWTKTLLELVYEARQGDTSI